MKNLRQIVLTFALLAVTTASAEGQQKLTREAYILKYKPLAVEQMDIYGIPASIKLAQALFESDNGNSRLAREANNHFGIKCKSNWTGQTISHTDDAPDECFRKYPSVEESYRDHSEFLDKSARYQDLFKLDPTDYKGWAHGLQKAGYATNPQYAQQLIKIIEDYQLFLLDEGQDVRIAENAAPVEEPVAEPIPSASPADMVDVDNYSVSIQGRNGGHTVYRNNGSLFIVVRNGDKLESVASEFRVSPKKLVKYNDLDIHSNVKTGDMIYIRPKAKRSSNGKMIHVARDGETLHSISQMYGIRLKSLCNINRRSRDSQVTEGQQIRLM